MAEKRHASLALPCPFQMRRLLVCVCVCVYWLLSRHTAAALVAFATANVAHSAQM